MFSNSNQERMRRRVERAPQERSRAAQHSTHKESPAAKRAARARRQAQRMGGQR